MMLRLTLLLAALSAGCAAQNHTVITVLPITNPASGAPEETGRIRYRDLTGKAVSLRAPDALVASYDLRWPQENQTGCVKNTAAMDEGQLEFAACATFPVTDDTVVLSNLADPTKQIRFSAASIGTGQTRVVTFQDADHTAAGIDITNTFSASQVFNNTINLEWKDTSGTARKMLYLDSSNNFHAGPEDAPGVGGDLILATRGAQRVYLSNNLLYPVTARTISLGTSTNPWSDLVTSNSATILRTGSPIPGFPNLMSGRVILESEVGGKYLRIFPHYEMSADVSLYFPASQGSSGQTLINDGSGNLSWGTPGGVTSVSGSSPISSSGGSTPTISCSTCVTTNTTQTISATKTFSASQVFNNTINLEWKDTSGTARKMLYLDSSNNFHAGPEDAPGVGGDLILATRGAQRVYLSNNLLYPVTARTISLGTSTNPWSDLVTSNSATILRTGSPIPGSPNLMSGRVILESEVGGKYLRIYPNYNMSSDVNLYYPASQGAAGQALINDGSGQYSWGTPVLATGTHTLSGTYTISGGSFTIDSTSNFYNRSFSGSGVSCSGVADGWTGWDTTGQYLIICAGGNRYRTQLTSY